MRLAETKPICVAFVGVSAHAEEHLLPCLLLNRGYRLSCVASRDDAKATRLQRAFGFDDRASDWREAIATDGIGAVFVAGPPAFHFEVAMTCLNRHLPVFLEKPSAPSLRHLNELIDVAKAYPQTPTFVGYNFRHAPAFEKLLVTADAVSERRAILIRYLANKPIVPYWDYGSVLEAYLFAIAIHALEMAIHVAGEPSEISARYQALNDRRFSLQVGFRGSRGVIANLELGNYTPVLTTEYALLTSSGRRIVLNSTTPNTIQVTDVDGDEVRQCQIPVSRSPGDRDGLGYQSEIDAFRQALIGARPSSAPIEADLHVFRLIETILELVRA
jgi:phthalate 4,5-cis-dihydrodiol dehydrogenase